MVYMAPPKKQGGQRNAARAGARGKEPKGREILQSKQDLLVQLTRQAEENTRILERERVALGFQGPPPVAQQAPARQQHEQQPHRQQQQHKQPPPVNQRRRNGAGSNPHHIFPDHGNKKIFDPRQIPGLGGAGGARDTGGSPETDNGLNQTFPDSPNFFPGRVFAVPGTLPPPPPGQQLDPNLAEATVDVVTLSRAGGMGGSAMPPQYLQQQAVGPAPPPFGYGPGPGFPAPPMGGPYGSEPPPLDPRVAAKMEAEAKREAYRRELEDQIRAKQAVKDAEKRRRQEEDARWEARNAAMVQPWEGEMRGGRRQSGNGQPVQGAMPSPFVYPAPQGPPGPAGRLTVEVPNGGSGAMPGPSSRISAHGGTLMPPSMPSGGFAGSPPGQMQGMPYPDPGSGPVLSPSAIPPVSPGNRRFMARMNDLIAGPSVDQRRQAEEARMKLQMDLEQQIREKKERQARERAERERERLKEEAELKVYYDNMNPAPRGGAQPVAPMPPPMQSRGPDVLQGGMFDNGPPQPRRRGKGKIIDATWLDAPPPQPQLPPPQPSQGMGMESPPAQMQGPRFGRRGAVDMAGPYADGNAPPPLSNSPPPGTRSPSPGPARGPGPGGATVTGLLHQLQEEQSRMREEFARQAAAMEKLANDAGRAVAERDNAWRELQQVKAMLAAAGDGGGPAPSNSNPSYHSGGPGGSNGYYGDGSSGSGGAYSQGGPYEDSLEQFASTVVINTHMVPKTLNSIPDTLPQPLACEVLRRGHTDPGPHAAAGPMRQLSIDGRPMDLDELDRFQAAQFGRGSMRGGRSGIPRPPGLGPGAAGRNAARPPPIQSVYGLGYEPPPQSRYNGFFSGAGADRVSEAGGPGGSRNLTIKPPSPAILRGDHLPSPTKQARGQQGGAGGAGAGGAGRLRSGRPGGTVSASERGQRSQLPGAQRPGVVRRGADSDSLGGPPGGQRGAQGRVPAKPAPEKAVRRGKEGEKLLRTALPGQKDGASAGAGGVMSALEGLSHLPALAVGAVALDEGSQRPSSAERELPSHSQITIITNPAAPLRSGSAAAGSKGRLASHGPLDGPGGLLETVFEDGPVQGPGGRGESKGSAAGSLAGAASAGELEMPMQRPVRAGRRSGAQPA